MTVVLRNRVGIEPCPRIGNEAFKQRRDRAELFRRRVEHARAYEVVRQVRMKNAVGGQCAGILGEYHAPDPRFVSHLERVQPGGPAEGDHGEFAGIDALLEQRQADRGAKIRVDHGEQSLRRGFGREAERLGHLGIDHAAGRLAVEAHPAAQKFLAVDPAERDIRIRHRRPGAAAAIAGGARSGAGALRPDRQPLDPAAPSRASRRRRRWRGSRPSECGPACGPPRPA